MSQALIPLAPAAGAPGLGRSAPAGAPGPLRRFLRSPRAIASLIWLVGVLLLSVLSPLIAQNPLEQDLNDLGAGPSFSHLLGTDDLGRDVFSRILHGGVGALEGTVLCVAVAAALGVTAGLFAGFTGGLIETVSSFFSDVLQTMPAVIVILLALSLFGSNLNIGMIVLGILLSASFYQLARTTTKAIRRELFVDAARVAGLTRRRIIVVHILPNIRRPVVVLATVTAAVALLLEAGLSFLGQGPPPPAPEWGSMVQEAAQELFSYPWLIFPTGGVIILTALAFNFLGDALNDASVPLARARAFARGGPRDVPRRDGHAITAGQGELLEVEGLTVAFPSERGPQVVVDDVSLRLQAGGTLALVGESGCGKTMTALAIMGLLPPSGRIIAGHIRFAGRELVGLSELELARIRGSGIGFISQEPIAALDPSFTVGCLIREPLRRHQSLGRTTASRRALELLALVGIARAPKVARSYAHELSGGMAQRVAIAIALAGDPRLLIADEPTTALDVTVQAEILDLLRNLQAQTGVGILLVTHDWGVVADMATRVCVMYAGQVVEEAPADVIFARPLHPYSEALLKSTPRSGRPGEALPTIPGSVPLPSEWPLGCRFANRCQYVTQACTLAPIPVTSPRPGRLSRCTATEVLAEEPA